MTRLAILMTGLHLWRSSNDGNQRSALFPEEQVITPNGSTTIGIAQDQSIFAKIANATLMLLL